jgi:hypothetical protein
LKRPFSKEDTEITNKYIRCPLTSLLIRKIKIKNKKITCYILLYRTKSKNVGDVKKLGLHKILVNLENGKNHFGKQLIIYKRKLNIYFP